MSDLLIIEQGNGGDALLKGNDLAFAEGYENLPYLAMFSGDDWFGNNLMDGDESTLFLSHTEVALKTYALNSAGRIKIEEAIKADLEHIKKNIPETDIDVATMVTGDNRLEINISINGQSFYYSWHPDEAYLKYKV